MHKGSAVDLSYEDVVDIVVGSSILASGGGGSERDAMDIAKRIFKRGLRPQVVDGRTIRDRDLVFSTTDVGGGVDKEAEERFENIYKQKIPLKWKRFPLEKWSPVAIRELSDYLGKTPDVYLCLELGPRFVEVIEHACKAGKPMIDGDTTGRAVPELPMSKLFLDKAPFIAAASTSHFGDVMILKSTPNYRRMDDIVRSFAIASGGGAGLAIALTGKTTKKSLLYGTLSQCKELGHAVKINGKKDGYLGLLSAISHQLSGRLLFKGRLTATKVEQKAGHLYGEHTLDGSGDFQSHEMRIWFKNENHVAWIDGKPCATSPDIISLVDPETELGLWNFGKLPRDHDLCVVGVPSPKFWQTKKGLDLLGPRAFGFNIDYRPIGRTTKW